VAEPNFHFTIRDGSGKHMPDCPGCTIESLRARVAELEAREQRIREAAFYPLFNSLESVATIKTILTLG